MEFKNVVFMFHKITSKNWFKTAIEIISRVYKFISIDEIDSYFYGNKTLKNACHISFDDGDRSIYEHAYPVLKTMGLPASLFISPRMIKQKCNYWFQEVDYITEHEGDALLKRAISRMFQIQYSVLKKFRIGSILKQLKLEEILSVIAAVKKKNGLEIKKKYNLTVNQILEFQKSNLFTFGAHTITHPILKNENDRRVEQEIRESINELSEMLNEKVNYFAYPNGLSRLDFGNREMQILKDLDVRLAFSTDPGNFNKKNNPLSIPRLSVNALGDRATLLYQIVAAPMWIAAKNANSKLNIDLKERLEIIEKRILVS